MSCGLSGFNVEVNIGFESAFGVPILTTGYKIPFNPTLVARTEQAINQSTTLRGGTSSASQPFLGFKDGQFSTVVPVDSKAFGLFMRGLFGTPTTTADSPAVGLNTHVFKESTSCNTMFCEVVHTDVAGGMVYTTTGIALNTMAFSLGGDGELLATFTGIAKDTTQSTASAITTVLDYSDGDFFGNFQASIVGVTDVKTFDISFSNNYATDNYTIDAGASRSSASKGTSTVSGSFNAIYTETSDANLYTQARSFTTVQLTATLDNGGAGTALRSIEFDMEETKFQAITNPQISAPNVIEDTLNFSAFLKNGGNGTSLQVTIVNDVASYA